MNASLKTGKSCMYEEIQVFFWVHMQLLIIILILIDDFKLSKDWATQMSTRYNIFTISRQNLKKEFNKLQFLSN